MPIIPAAGPGGPGDDTSDGRMLVDRKWSNLREEDFLIAVRDAQRRSRNETTEWRSGAREDFDFYGGDQWTPADKAKLLNELRPIVVFNRTAPTIDAVSGMQRFNRQQVAYLPRTTGPTPDQVPDAAIAEGFTATVDYHRDQADSEDEESQMFHDSVISGMGWTETWVDYDSDPDGIIRNDRISPLEMYWDPTATKSNLADARWVARVKMMHVQDIEEIFGVSLEVVQDPAADQLLDFDAGHHTHGHDHGTGHHHTSTSGAGTRFEGFIPVLQIQWMERDKIVRFRDPETNRFEEMDQADFNALVEAGSTLGGVTMNKKRLFQAFIAGPRVLDRGELHPPAQSTDRLNQFTFQCITGKLNHNDRTWHGLMRQMKDPQRFANKFLSQTMHIMNTGAKGGILAEKSAFDSPQKAEQDWAKNARIVWAAEGAISGPKPKVIPRDPSPMPPAIGELLMFSVNSIREVTGVNVEFLGTRGKFNPVGVEQSRIQQGMAVLSDLFDSLRRYRKMQGRVMLHLVQLYVPDGQMVRIAGTQEFAQFRRRPDIKFDIVIDQTPTTPNQKSEVWQSMVQLLPAMFRAGIPVPPDIIDFAPLPDSVIRRIKEFFQQQSQAQEPAQQMEAQQKQAEIAETMAKAARDQAQAQAAIMNAQAKQQSEATEAREADIKMIDTLARNEIDKLKVAVQALEAAKPETKEKDNAGS